MESPNVDNNEGGSMDEARDALAEAMFKAEYSDPNSDGVDREWMSRGLNETGYRAEIVIGLLHEAGFSVVKVDDA